MTVTIGNKNYKSQLLKECTTSACIAKYVPGGAAPVAKVKRLFKRHKKEKA